MKSMRAYSPITSEHERRDSYRESKGFLIFASPEKDSRGDNDHGHTSRARTLCKTCQQTAAIGRSRGRSNAAIRTAVQTVLRRLLRT